MKTRIILAVLFVSGIASIAWGDGPRSVKVFTTGWKFHQGDMPGAQLPPFDDAAWRQLDLPHDWSIEGPFAKEHPATPDGGALPGGIGWYRKSFSLPESERGRQVFIEFDGVYRHSEVWINGQYLGKRPNGYISFRYNLTPYVTIGSTPNVIAVRVDNAQQPNSRWYSGSGIYRNVRLVTTGSIGIDHWGVVVTTPQVSERSASIRIATIVRNFTRRSTPMTLRTQILDPAGKVLATAESAFIAPSDSTAEADIETELANPQPWTLEHPVMYQVVSTVVDGSTETDQVRTSFGIRTFSFDVDKGFFINGVATKIRGVCNHHDLGALGSAVNRRALERQLEIMKAMGVNAIRTSHNPPAPELLDLCDRMGFLVLDEAFDMWKKKKTTYDYSLDWDAWHVRDLEDQIKRDRNHPSIFAWSIGNEVEELWDTEDSTGTIIARELASIVKRLDPTRPVTAACNNQDVNNPVIRSGALDLIGYNYAHRKFSQFQTLFPGKIFLGTETTSSLTTRNQYVLPADSIRRWPTKAPFIGMPDNSCSGYDNLSTPWGSTHEESWREIKKYSFLSGLFIWTGFDYLGEPTPYGWPSRSSYFGIVDLAGFPKDPYYLYKSEWTTTPTLHLLPHWNWSKGDTVDVWAYTNAEDVELFLNGRSLGVKKKVGEDLHLSWRVPFAPGALRAEGRVGGKITMKDEVRTAGAPARIELSADRTTLASDGDDLSFVTVRILDKNGTLVPFANASVAFTLSGNGRLVAVDNGSQTSHASFQASECQAFNGMCLAVIRSTGVPGTITLNAKSPGLRSATIQVRTSPTP